MTVLASLLVAPRCDGGRVSSCPTFEKKTLLTAFQAELTTPPAASEAQLCYRKAEPPAVTHGIANGQEMMEVGVAVHPGVFGKAGPQIQVARQASAPGLQPLSKTWGQAVSAPPNPKAP